MESVAHLAPPLATISLLLEIIAESRAAGGS
jgi:hypothetical protein